MYFSTNAMPEVGTKRTNYGHEEVEDPSQKKPRQDGDSLRLLVLGNYAGSLIGKGGENFKRLREKYTAMITGLSTRANERVLQLDGPRPECLGIVSEVLPLMPLARYNSWSGKSALELNMLANTDAVGMVIGKGGMKLREISENSNTKCKVYPECLPNSNERVVAVSGETTEAVVKAVELILGILEGAPMKSETVFFDPANLDGKPMPNLQVKGKSGNGITTTSLSALGLPETISDAPWTPTT